MDDLGYNDPDASGQGGTQRLAEDFSFPVSVIVSKITFLGGYYRDNTPLTDSFTLTIYNDSSGLPDPSAIVAQIDLVDVSRTDTGTNYGTLDIYEYTASFENVHLSANTVYWLLIVNDTSNDANDNWVWAGTHEGGIVARSIDSGTTWSRTFTGSFSFFLERTADGEDECPDSDLRATVIIDGCDSMVSNTLFPNGCTISDLIATCTEDVGNHGQFVNCVSQLTNDLKKTGTLTGHQKGAIQSCAAKATLTP